MVTTRYLAKQSYANLGVAIPNFARFLINDLGGQTGPGWTIVEAQSGANREVPSTPTDMDSLVSATDWPNGTISVNDWIVLESADANNTNHFQLYLEYQSTTVMNVIMFPLEDFSTGGGAASPPTFPATAVGSGGSVIPFDGYTTSANYSCVADEGMVMFLADDGTNTIDWMYIGEVDGARANGSPPDDRAYVIYDTPDVVYLPNTTTNRWNRLSPSDDSTILTLGGQTLITAPVFGVIHDSTTVRDNLLGPDSILPVGCFFEDTSHQHFAGFLRNCYSGARLAGTSATLDNRNFLLRNNSVGAEPALVMSWDGVTDYP